MRTDDSFSIPKPVLARMPRYRNYLTNKKSQGFERISSTVIAADLGLNPVQVRKDLAYINDSGKPRTGFDVKTLTDDIERYLGYNHPKSAILVGAGNLGQALLAYEGFSEYSLRILAAFDIDPDIIGQSIHGKPVYAMTALREKIVEHDVKIAIVTVPARNAQSVCEQLALSGIEAIWNFAPVHLEAPDNVIIQNEDIAASLAFLYGKLEQSSK